MWNTRGDSSHKLVNTLDAQQYLLFYKLMQYPVPKSQTPFLVEKKIWPKKTPTSITKKSFSRTKKTPLMNEYLQEIEKYAQRYKSLPFIQEIFLCNSITFNALHENSDIDFFIITQPNRIRSAKFRAMVLFSFIGIKRTLNKKAKKICLSFFVTSDQQNLYWISLPNLDIYLSYRIQHLVLLYQTNPQIPPEIFHKNKRVQGTLPNYSFQQTIFLGNEVFSWNTKFKTSIERINRGVIGDFFERILKYLQLFIIRLKILRNPERNKDVIINDQMLKFHQDIRKKISLKYSMMVK
jgi:hypothetical protein